MDDFLLKFFPKVYRKRHSAKTDNYCLFDNEVLTAFTSSLYLAALITAAAASYFTRRYGRKASMMTGGICFVGGSVLNAAAQNLAMLLLGRVVLGIGLGFANQSFPLYISEMAPPKLRGGLNGGMVQVFICIGGTSAFLVNYLTVNIIPEGWRISLGVAIVPSMIILLGSLYLPDSPSSLIQRGLMEEAKVVLEKMRGTTEVQDELEDLVEAKEACKEAKQPWRNILEARYRPALVTGIAIPVFQQLAGINMITFYAPVLFQTLGMGSNASLYSAVILGGGALLAAIVASLVIDKLGRRPLLLIGGCVMVAAMIMVAVMLQVKLGPHNVLGRVDAALVVLAICIYVLSFGWSWGPVVNMTSSEIYPLEVRSVGQSINVCLIMFFVAVQAQVFLAMLCKMKAGLFYMFGGCIGLALIFVWWLLPETKNVPIEAMTRVWENHPIWGKFATNSTT